MYEAEESVVGRRTREDKGYVAIQIWSLNWCFPISYNV